MVFGYQLSVFSGWWVSGQCETAIGFMDLFILPPSSFSLQPLPPQPGMDYSIGVNINMEISAAMKCPFCHVDHDRVIDTRASEDGIATRRRRECLDCKRRYTTYERIEGTTVKIVKKDGSREPFDRSKIKKGLEKACWKRPISDAQLETIVSDVENEIETNYEAEVESPKVGEMVMRRLCVLDQVAYVRFASVYRQFKDARDFVDELRLMLAESRRLE
jgi:transcriptional repressor NrdR